MTDSDVNEDFAPEQAEPTIVDLTPKDPDPIANEPPEDDTEPPEDDTEPPVVSPPHAMKVWANAVTGVSMGQGDGDTPEGAVEVSEPEPSGDAVWDFDAEVWSRPIDGLKSEVVDEINAAAHRLRVLITEGAEPALLSEWADKAIYAQLVIDGEGTPDMVREAERDVGRYDGVTDAVSAAENWQRKAAALRDGRGEINDMRRDLIEALNAAENSESVEIIRENCASHEALLAQVFHAEAFL